jgi:anti-sigma B factor antagonist
LEGIRLETGQVEVNGKKVLNVTGEIDVYTAPQFKEAVNDILADGEKHLVIDMAGVTYMDSSGFGTLLSATKRLRPQGGTVNLVKVSPAIDRILRITRLNTIFGTYDNVDEAISALTEEQQ